MDSDKFKEHQYKAFTPWSDDQLSYLEDRLTSFMTRLQRHIKESEKFLNDLGLKVIAALIEGDNQPSFAVFKNAGYAFHSDIAYYSKRTSPND